MTDRKTILERIEKRRVILEAAKANLKSYFVGLDTVIDEIIQNIESWFLFPESVTRPVILNLWGMTGVGKTDLVRRLVRELQMYDNFVELQMDDGIRGFYTIKDVLLSSNINEGEPGILLLDEIQRFRTQDAFGHEIKNERFNDVWMILSDGKFSHDVAAKSNMQEWFLDAAYFDEIRQDEKAKKDKNKNNDAPKSPDTNDVDDVQEKRVHKFKMSHWEAIRFRKLFRLKNSVEEIMQWTKEERENLVAETLSQGNIGEAYDYTKLLIVICGNLDEAYRMNGDDASDADIDADTLHAYSQKISIVRIKKALSTRFKPEQISRLGNTHVIYRSLSKKNYEEIIQRKLNDVIVRFKQHLNVSIHIDPTINEIIYRNGVYPSQGVRPIFTTISSVFESYLPYFLLQAVQKNVDDIIIRYEDPYLYAQIGNEEFVSQSKVKLDLDVIREKINIREIALTSVHEAGHALAYMLLFKIVPSEVKSKLTNYTSGYIITHESLTNKTNLLENVQIFLAGMVAEDIVFGNSLIGVGSANDISQATRLTSDYVRTLSMDGILGKVVHESRDNSDACLTDTHKDINERIESLLKEQKEKVRTLLTQNSDFLKAVATTLYHQHEIKTEELFNIAKEFVSDIRMVPKDYSIYANYDELLEKYFSQVHNRKGE